MNIDLGRDGYYLVPEADEEIIFVPRDSCPPLEFLQELVGGLIERVCVLGGEGPRADMIVNEEGRMGMYRPNPRASKLYYERIRLPVALVGTAVILCGKARLT